MIYKFRTLGLALIATLAVGSIIATVAQAQPGTLTTNGKGVIVTAEQAFGEHEFALTDHPNFSGGFLSMKCVKATFTGTEVVTEGAGSIRLHPEYSGCNAFGLSATVITTGCDYVLNAGTQTPSFTGWHATTGILCTLGSTINIVAATCEVRVGGEQGLLTTSEVTNSGSGGTGMDLLLHLKVTDIRYTVVKDGIGCPLSGTGVFQKGDYTGTTTVKAYDPNAEPSIGVTVKEPFAKAGVVTGEQVGENTLQLTDHLIKGQPASVKCKTAEFTSTEAVEEVGEELQVHPVLQSCIAFGVLGGATVTTTNCDYLLHIGSPTAGGWHVTTDVACSGESTIKIVAGNCEVTTGSQVGLTTSEVTNSGSGGTGMDLLLHTGVAGIHYTVVKDGVGCPLSGTGNFSQGDYTGTTTVGAHDPTELGPVGITFH